MLWLLLVVHLDLIDVSLQVLILKWILEGLLNTQPDNALPHTLAKLKYLEPMLGLKLNALYKCELGRMERVLYFF